MPPGSRFTVKTRKLTWRPILVSRGRSPLPGARAPRRCRRQGRPGKHKLSLKRLRARKHNSVHRTVRHVKGAQPARVGPRRPIRDNAGVTP